MSRKWLLVALAVVTAIALLAAPAVAMAAASYVGAVGSPATLNSPRQVATDYLGNIYVADGDNHRVQVFDVNGAFVRTIGSGDFTGGPFGVAVDRWLYVYAVDNTTGIVHKYDVFGNPVGSFGSAGPGPGELQDPFNIAVDNFGYVYIADFGNDRIQKFDAFGNYKMQIGSGAPTPAQLTSPAGVAVSQDGRTLYTADFFTPYRVQMFATGTGAYIGQFATGSGNPGSIAVDPDGYLWLSETNGFQRVLKYAPTGGAFIEEFGNSPDYFGNIGGLGVDNLYLYASDWGGDRVQVFRTNVPKATVRVGGATRYDVAANLVLKRWPTLTGIQHVIVVCGEDRANADPLASAGLAGVYDAPVLLTNTSKLSPATYNLLKAIRSASGPVAIHVVGGKNSIPKAVYNKIATTNPGGSIERIDGSDRYVLAANIAARVKSQCDAKGVIIPGVLIFNAENSKSFYDALAASPMAARAHLPMLAVRSKSVPSATLAALAGPFAGKERYVVSSSGYISEGVRTQVGSNFRFATTTNRATTAQQIAYWARLRGWLTYTNVVGANALPDSLTGGSFAGLQDGILLYTDKASLPAPTTASLTNVNWKHGTFRGWVLGGTTSVSDAAFNQFNAALNTP